MINPTHPAAEAPLSTSPSVRIDRWARKGPWKLSETFLSVFALSIGLSRALAFEPAASYCINCAFQRFYQFSCPCSAEGGEAISLHLDPRAMW